MTCIKMNNNFLHLIMYADSNEQRRGINGKRMAEITAAADIRWMSIDEIEKDLFNLCRASETIGAEDERLSDPIRLLVRCTIKVAYDAAHFRRKKDNRSKGRSTSRAEPVLSQPPTLTWRWVRTLGSCLDGLRLCTSSTHRSWRLLRNTLLLIP